MRVATITRTTKETNVAVTVNQSIVYQGAIRGQRDRTDFATPAIFQLRAGDTIEFAVGGQYTDGNTGLAAAVTLVSG